GHHDDAVGQFQIADADRVKENWHAVFHHYSVRGGSQFPADAIKNVMEDRHLAREEDPLPDRAAGDQPGPLQSGQVRRYRRLREAGPLVDLSGADAVLTGLVLLGKVALRLLQPLQDFPAQWVGEGLDDVIEIVGHGVRLVRYIAMERTIYR